MNFYIGVLGLVFIIRDNDDVPKMCWGLEEEATKDIATDILRQMQWPPLNLQTRRGVTTSVLGSLYDPVEYKEKNIPRLHRDITFALLEEKSIDSVNAPPPPAKIVKHEGPRAYLRVLPVLIYGETHLVTRVFKKKLNATFILNVIRENLSLSGTTEILAYNSIVGQDEVDDWIQDTLDMIRSRYRS